MSPPPGTVAVREYRCPFCGVVTATSYFGADGRLLGHDGHSHDCQRPE